MREILQEGARKIGRMTGWGGGRTGRQVEAKGSVGEREKYYGRVGRARTGKKRWRSRVMDLGKDGVLGTELVGEAEGSVATSGRCEEILQEGDGRHRRNEFGGVEGRRN